MTHITKSIQPAGSPAMDHNGFVSSSPLYHQHMLNDCHDGRRGGTQTLSGPAGHLKLHESPCGPSQTAGEKPVYTDTECRIVKHLHKLF